MRRLGLRMLAGLFAFGWIVLPGFGAIDLAVTWSADWPQVLEAGWGLYFTVLVGAGFVLVAAQPSASRPGVEQLAIATLALAVSAVVAEEGPLLWVVAALAVETAIVCALARREWRAVPGRREVSAPLLLLGAIGFGPWTAYALDMWALNREELFDADLTNGIDHYAVQGSVGLALAVLPTLAALRSTTRPFVPLCAGVVASYLGLVSLAWPEAAGGLGTAWSAAAMAWGVALVGVPLVPRRRARAS